ncbi:MAG TPA: methyltransferase [Clostridia bacterium]|nr:methyltransferase [Clostridia bacterium]
MSENEHYYSEHPTSTIKERDFKQKIKNTELTLTSVSGVFAFEDRVDRASQLLIEAFEPSGASVLDLGCGYGAVGLFIKAMFGKQSVILSDINERAVEYALKNASENRLDVNAVKSNLYSAFDGVWFDDIATNPPLATGKKLLTQLINEAFDHLNLNGALWLVAYHNKGGETLREIMRARFGNAVDIVKSGGIRVYRSVKM